MNLRARRGFTLIELMIAAAIGATVLAAGTAIVVSTAAASRRSRDISSMRRSASLVFDLLSSELRVAGLGVPTGVRKGGADRFPPRIYKATPTEIDFLADVPRPNSALNGFSRVADDCTTTAPGTRPANGLPLLNELNNNCDIRTVAGVSACNSTSASLTALAGDDDCAANRSSPSCPWALQKYQLGEYLIVQDFDGSWTEVQVDSSNLWQQSGVGAQRFTLELSAPNANLLTYARGAFVSSPDRLTYKLAGGQITRAQCWDSVGNPVNDFTSVACGAGIGPEVLADHVTAFSLAYFDVNGNPTASLPDIQRVDVKLDLQGSAGAPPPTEEFTTSISLRESP